MEINPDPASIEERVRSSVAGVIECNLATEEVFGKGVLKEEVDVLICSLVFDVVCTEPGQLEVVMRRNGVYPSCLCLCMCVSLFKKTAAMGFRV